MRKNTAHSANYYCRRKPTRRINLRRMVALKMLHRHGLRKGIGYLKTYTNCVIAQSFAAYVEAKERLAAMKSDKFISGGVAMQLGGEYILSRDGEIIATLNQSKP